MPDLFITEASLRQFERNLKLIEDWADREILEGLQAGASEVIQHAQAGHGRPASKAERIAHPDPRFYTWSSRLTNSMRLGETRVFKDGAQQEILAGGMFGGQEVDYAMAVEFGTSRSRAFPFFGPALKETGNKVLAILAKAIRRALKS